MSARVTLGRCGRSERGVTLIELMVAVTVGLVLLSGVISLFVSNKKAYRIQEATNSMNENARYAASQIENHLRMAAHWGGGSRDKVDVDGGITTLPSDCTPNAPMISPTGIKGFDGTGATSPLACIPDADYVSNSDMVALHFAGPERNTDSSVAGSGVSLFVRAVVGQNAVIFEGQDLSSINSNNKYSAASVGNQTNLVPNYTYNSIIYFLRPCASMDRGDRTLCEAGVDDEAPTLTRLVLSGNQLVQEDVVPGVEQLQIAYGVDLNGDATADRYDNATAVEAASNWSSVVAVRLSMLVRSDEPDVNYTDANTYRLFGGASGAGVSYTVPTAARHYHRRLFNFTIQIRNNVRGMAPQ